MVYNGKSHLEMDDLGVPLFQETPILGNLDLSFSYQISSAHRPLCHRSGQAMTSSIGDDFARRSFIKIPGMWAKFAWCVYLELFSIRKRRWGDIFQVAKLPRPARHNDHLGDGHFEDDFRGVSSSPWGYPKHSWMVSFMENPIVRNG